MTQRLHRAASWLAGRREVRQERPMRRAVPLLVAAALAAGALPHAPRTVTVLAAIAAVMYLLAEVI